MADFERTREHVREPDVETFYDKFIRSRREFEGRQTDGSIVIKLSDREYQQTRQGRLLHYLNPMEFKDTPLQDWRVFMRVMRPAPIQLKKVA